jgi:hypothetical protein
MWFRSVFDYLKIDSRNRGRRPRSATSRLLLELLEDRSVPSFRAPVPYAVGQVPASVAAGDFARNGIQDLVVTDYPNSVDVLMGNGDSTFHPGVTFPTGAYPVAVAVGDFTGHGNLDLVTADRGNAVSVLLGKGDGTFQAPIDFTLPGVFPPGYTGSTALAQLPVSLAIGDMNHDGRLDVVVTTQTGSSTFPNTYSYVDVLLGRGDGTFSLASITQVHVSELGSLALADFNGDGNLDVGGVSAADSKAYMFLGHGDGTLGAPTTYATGSSPRALAVGDFNGDGKLDLATANYLDDSMSVLLGNGDGSFRAPLNTALPPLPGLVQTQPAVPQGPTAIVMGDLNRDGKMDLAVTTRSAYLLYQGRDLYGAPYYATAYTSHADVLLGNGDGTFTATQTIPLINGFYPNPVNKIPVAITAGNFNNDAFPDLAVGDSNNNTVSVLINTADWPSRFGVSGFPSSTTAGVAGNFTVTAKNTDGTTATGYTGTVRFTSSDGQAVLPADYTFTAADQGMHTFGATLKTAGAESVTATDAATAGLSGSETGITVNPAAASQLVIGQQPSTTTSGQAISPAVTVDVEDPYGNVVTSNSSTVTLTLGSGTFEGGSATASATVSGGVATFSTLKIDTAGSYTLRATDGSLTSASSGSFTVTPSTLAVAGFPSPVTAGVAASFTVTVKNADGSTATGYTGTVHFTSSDPHAVLSADYTFTAADRGVHTFSATLKTAGARSITATDAAMASLIGSETGITVNPAAASQFILSAPSSVTAGASFNLTVTVQDAYGNVVTGYTGTVHFSSSDNRGTLPSNYTFTTTDKGVHTFTGLVLRKRGNQKITITDVQNSSLFGNAIVDVL